MADQEGVAQPAAQPELPIGEPEALQPAAPLEEEQAQHVEAQHVEDFLAQELEEADVQSLAQRSQRSHYQDPLVEAAWPPIASGQVDHERPPASIIHARQPHG